MSDLDARYGRRPPLAGWLRMTLIGTGLALLVLAVVGIYLLYESGRPDTHARLLAYEVLSDETVEARIEVTKPANSDVVCDVIAQGDDTAVVGRTSIDVVDDKSTVVIDVVVATTSRAVLADVDGCRLG